MKHARCPKIAAIAGLSLIPMLGTAGSLAQEIAPLPGTNLALGRSVELSPPPSYSLCAGGDATDLTDGRTWRPSGADEDVDGMPDVPWTDAGTVGWDFGREPGALITIDLGAVRALDAIGLTTTAGRSQVTFPAAAFVYVSADGETWRYAADLINEAIPQDRFVHHRFAVEDLTTAGRFVAIYLLKGGFYGFVDEVEIIEGDHGVAAATSAESPMVRAEIEADALRRGPAAIQQKISLYLIEAARDQVLSMAGGDDDPILAELEQLREQVLDGVDETSVEFAGGPPYTTLDRALFSSMGELFQRRESAPVSVWAPEISMWEHTTNPFRRPQASRPPLLHADMMAGEHEPVAFNLSNNTPHPRTVEIRVDDLRSSDGQSTWPADSVERRVTTHVVSSGYLLVDDALPPIADGALNLPAGMTRQVWLILDARGVRPGEYATQAMVRDGEHEHSIPLAATVYPMVMPRNPEYTAQTWGYFTWEPAAGHESEAAAEMERCYENAHVLHHEYMPWPRVDEQTKMLVRPIEVDFSRLDEMLGYRPYVKQWLLWTGFEFGLMSLNRGGAKDAPEVGTPEHETLFAEWVRQIRDHMEEKGYATDRWAFYWVDEPGDAAFERYIVPASAMAKGVDPSILIWEDHQVSLALLEEHPDAIDIHACPLDYYRRHPEILEHAHAEEQASVHYVCASSKLSDPHRYYRLHHMASVELGLDGAGMWVWGDDGGQFSDYAGPHTSYGMVYAGEGGPVTSKRREAWREGIEDVELWRYLRRAAERTGDADLRWLLEEGPGRLLQKTGYWHQHQGTPEALRRMRLRVLEAVAAARAGE